MKQGLTFALAGFLLFSCSSTNKKLKYRWPSSLMASQAYDARFTLYAGSGMPKDLVIAKSLPNAPLKVILDNPASNIHCKDSEGKEAVEFLLVPNRSGKYTHISCALDHSGSEYPEKAELKVSFSVLLDDYEIPESEYKTKNELKHYLSVIENREEWSPAMLNYIHASLPTKSLKLDPGEFLPQPILGASPDDPVFISISDFNGTIINDGLFSDKSITVAGLSKRNKKFYYPNYNEKAVVCGLDKVTADSNKQLIKQVLIAEGEIFQNNSLKENFFCQFNFKTGVKSTSKDHHGYILVNFKAASYYEIKQLLSKFIQDEESQIERRIKNYHAQEFNRLKSDVREIQLMMSDWLKKQEAIIAQIDRDKFVAYKDKVIGSLFSEKIKGKISRSASNITITPVKKIIYDEKGQQRALLYLNLTNSIAYKIETPEFNSHEDRELPFEEKVNLFLPTSDEFGQQASESIVVCNNRIDAFYEALGELQSQMNDYENSQVDVLKALKKHSVASATGCDLDQKDVKEIEYVRGKGQDFSILWSKTVVGDSEILKANKVGAKFYSDFLGKVINHELFRDGKGLHPAFKPGFNFTVNKGKAPGAWNEERKGYLQYFDEEAFVKVGK